MIAAKAAALRAYPAAAAPVSAFAGNQVAEPPDVNRGLTPEELDIARSVFGDTLDLTQITLSDGGGVSGNLADLDDNARTVGDGVIFPAGTLTRAANDAQFRENVFKPLLVHELAHVWQYQHGADVSTLLPTALAGGVFKHVYDFGDLGQAKAEGKPFLQFNYEQQANIVSAYYAMNRTAGITDPENPYRHYIDQVRRVPRGEQVIYPPPPTPII
jgi:type VI secretion system secreted protein VgrG